MADQSSVTQDLHEFLTRKGFAFIQMAKNAVGHFELRALVNGHDLLLLVDTGASRTVLHREVAERLGLVMTASAQRAGGVGTADHVVELAGGVSIIAGGHELTRDGSVPVLDLSHVSRSLISHGGTAIDGAIGGDILTEQNAIIDYAAGRLYLQNRA